jgi:uncharacterized membrane protein
VEFPQPGNYVLGFVTNELKDLENGTKVTVFIPTGFVPPAGHLLFVPKEKILPSQFTIEEAIKTIMSVGMVAPSTVSIHVSGAPSSPEKEPFANFKEIKYVK